MRFRYIAQRTQQPVYPRRGARHRMRPVLGITLRGPSGSSLIDAVADSGADDTIFPARIAQRLGVSLVNAPTGDLDGVGGGVVTCYYANVTLRLSDGVEFAEWDALVAFADPIPRPLLGHVGFFDFFDVTFRGAAQEVVIVPDANFLGKSGTH